MSSRQDVIHAFWILLGLDPDLEPDVPDGIYFKDQLFINEWDVHEFLFGGVRTIVPILAELLLLLLLLSLLLL